MTALAADTWFIVLVRIISILSLFSYFSMLFIFVACVGHTVQGKPKYFHLIQGQTVSGAVL